MEAHEHFAAGKAALKQAETATQPERLLGLAHGHFLAAQTIIAIHTFNETFGIEHVEEWDAAIDMEFDPSGKPVKR